MYFLFSVCIFFYIRCLCFVYPFGATLAVDKRSIPVLSTGSVCFPLFRPICAFHKVKVSVKNLLNLWFKILIGFFANCLTWQIKMYRTMHTIHFIHSIIWQGKGKLCVIGSHQIFSDQYIDKEENYKVQVRKNLRQSAQMDMWDNIN